MSCVLVVAENRHLGYCDLPVSLGPLEKAPKLALIKHINCWDIVVKMPLERLPNIGVKNLMWSTQAL